MGKVAIIGGGPAGLAAAQALNGAGVPFKLFEEGPPLSHREHDRAEQLGVGIGGAGLFSDGKFSFYPSGTNLYRLADRSLLRQSYEVIADRLEAVGIDAPPFPVGAGRAAAGGAFSTKDYKSSYGTLAQRMRLTDAFGDGCGASIFSFCSVTAVARREDRYAITYRKGRHGPLIGEVFEALVIASGRFGGRALAHLCEDELPVEEQRYELGIRLEHPNSIGFLRHRKNPDVKFILQEKEIEVRTFCTCRNGEVWMIPYDGIAALSGRSDGPPSGYSNFGLLPRFTGDNRALGRAVWDHYEREGRDRATALWQPLPEFLDKACEGPDVSANRPWNPREDFVRGDIEAALHPQLAAILKGSIRAIIERYPDMYSPETICLYPAIEGAGRFPSTDEGLRVPGQAIWCCGDVVGRFRGLIPALVSGHYAGASAAAHFTAEPVGDTALPAPSLGVSR